MATPIYNTSNGSLTDYGRSIGAADVNHLGNTGGSSSGGSGNTTSATTNNYVAPVPVYVAPVVAPIVNQTFGSAANSTYTSSTGYTYKTDASGTPTGAPISNPSSVINPSTLGTDNTKVTIPEPVVTDATSALAGLSAANQTRLDNQLALQNASDTSNTNLLKTLTDSIGTQPSEAQAYTDMFGQPISAENYQAQQKNVNELTARLDSITKGAQVAQQTLESQAGSKGVTSTFLGRQQQEISRSAAIQGLPISAELNAAQGNLQTATDNLNTLFKLKMDDATNAYNYKKDLYTAFYNVAATSEKAKLDLSMKALDNQYSEDQAKIASKLELGIYKAKAQIDANAMGSVNSNPTYTPVAPVSYTANGSESGGLYQIAQDNGLNFEALKAANPQLGADFAIKKGTIINLPSASNPPPTNASIMEATGLSFWAWTLATVGTSGLTRLDAATKTAAGNEWVNYQKTHGVDGATFKAQYEAYNKTVGANLLRNNQATVAENELAATVVNLRSAATEANLGNLSKLNTAKIWAGTQLNTPEASTFKFHLEQLRNEFAAYNSALQGVDANGNIRQITDADQKKADEYINNGFASGSLDGFEKALNASIGKMGVVLKNQIDIQNKSVWTMFGVGDKYKTTTTTSDTVNTGNLFLDYQKSTGASTSYTSPIDAINNFIFN